MVLLRRVIGDALRARRQAQHRTLREVSTAANVSLGYLSEIERGQTFVLDRQRNLGTAERVQLPHPELFEAVSAGARLLIDDGKVRLKVLQVEPARIVTEVEVGGTLSNNKGLNVPDVVVPIPALTEDRRKDHNDPAGDNGA